MWYIGATAHCASSMQRYLGAFREPELRGPLGSSREREDSDPGWSGMEKRYVLGRVRGTGADAALIPQLNAEPLRSSVRFPQTETFLCGDAQRKTEYEKHVHFGLKGERFPGGKYETFCETLPFSLSSHFI